MDSSDASDSFLSNLGIRSIDVDAVEQQVMATIRAGDDRTNLVREMGTIEREIAKAKRRNDAKALQELDEHMKRVQASIQKLGKQMQNAEKPISKWKDVDELPPILPADDVERRKEVSKALTLPPKPTIHARPTKVKAPHNAGRQSTAPTPDARTRASVKSELPASGAQRTCAASNGPHPTTSASSGPSRCQTLHPVRPSSGRELIDLVDESPRQLKHAEPPRKMNHRSILLQERDGPIAHPSSSSSSRPAVEKRVQCIDLDDSDSDVIMTSPPKEPQTCLAVIEKPKHELTLYPLDANNITPSSYGEHLHSSHKYAAGARKRGKDPADWHDIVAKKRKRAAMAYRDPLTVLPNNDDADDDFYDARVRDEDLARDCANAIWIVPRELRCPQYIWDLLYDYQRQSLQWLFQLHQCGTGGILADEMGLGKTVQMVAFIASLYCSEILQNMTVALDNGVESTGGVLLIAPATLMTQWRNEFRTWFPLLRVSVMHAVPDTVKRLQMRSACENNGIVITTYQTLRASLDLVLSFPWVYVILDEGHQIRNPDAAITSAVKGLHTSHRIILSGSPIQNNLKDLWSVVDFCAPGLLGTYPFFEGQFAMKIESGAQTCASPKLVEEGYQCAVILRDLTAPHLLRRTKCDVMQMLQLPSKQEHLLFCNLSPEQYQVYIDFLNTDTVKRAVAQRNSWGRGVPESFFCINILRKVSNHPDILLQHESELRPTDYGAVHRSGKLKVLDDILCAWKRQNHKVLIFSQTVTMLEVIQQMLQDRGYAFSRLDGRTPVKRRLEIIENFNSDPELFVFLLTTRVGGVGLNIVGANRVVIFDPDWNPMVDVQARERAWRIGQKREVIVYRLITVGTVEEKMYHRQVFKHFLAQKVLSDTRQRRFFKQNDLKDLFSPPPPPPGFDPAKMRLPRRYMELFAKYQHCDQLPLETDAVLGELQLLPLPDQYQPSGAAAHEHQSLMNALLQNSSVRSEFSHDKVEQPMLEEKLVVYGRLHAQQTLKALQDSARSRNSYPVNTPTWTGRTGVAGRENMGHAAIMDIPARKSIGAERLDKNLNILTKNIKEQQEENQAARRTKIERIANGDATGGCTLHVGDKKIAESILAFFLDKLKCPYRRASTGSVLDHFNPRIPAHSRNLFKSLLKHMCTLEQPDSANQPGFWRLKEEYN